MDEPLGALDRKLKDELQVEIKRVQRATGVTVLYVTHDQDEALILSDRIAIMEQGKLHQVGTPREIYESPRSAFVAQFMGESNSLEGVVETSANGIATVALQFNEVTVECQTNCAQRGDKVQAILRPESLELLPAGAESVGLGTAEGQIQELLYLGQSIRYLVRVGPALLKVRVAHRPGAPVYDPGSVVKVGFPKRTTVLHIERTS
jgi:ABC-type Fe3+/spermidine/putrescine transport system ATPase subunit